MPNKPPKQSIPNGAPHLIDLVSDDSDVLLVSTSGSASSVESEDELLPDIAEYLTPSRHRKQTESPSGIFSSSGSASADVTNKHLTMARGSQGNVHRKSSHSKACSTSSNSVHHASNKQSGKRSGIGVTPKLSPSTSNPSAGTSRLPKAISAQTPKGLLSNKSRGVSSSAKSRLLHASKSVSNDEIRKVARPALARKETSTAHTTFRKGSNMVRSSRSSGSTKPASAKSSGNLSSKTKAVRKLTFPSSSQPSHISRNTKVSNPTRKEKQLTLSQTRQSTLTSLPNSPVKFVTISNQPKTPRLNPPQASSQSGLGSPTRSTSVPCPAKQLKLTSPYQSPLQSPLTSPTHSASHSKQSAQKSQYPPKLSGKTKILKKTSSSKHSPSPLGSPPSGPTATKKQALQKTNKVRKISKNGSQRSTGPTEATTKPSATSPHMTQTLENDSKSQNSKSLPVPSNYVLVSQGLSSISRNKHVAPPVLEPKDHKNQTHSNTAAMTEPSSAKSLNLILDTDDASSIPSTLSTSDWTSSESEDTISTVEQLNESTVCRGKDTSSPLPVKESPRRRGQYARKSTGGLKYKRHKLPGVGMFCLKKFQLKLSKLRIKPAARLVNAAAASASLTSPRKSLQLKRKRPSSHSLGAMPPKKLAKASSQEQGSSSAFALVPMRKDENSGIPNNRKRKWKSSTIVSNFNSESDSSCPVSPKQPSHLELPTDSIRHKLSETQSSSSVSQPLPTCAKTSPSTSRLVTPHQSTDLSESPSPRFHLQYDASMSSDSDHSSECVTVTISATTKLGSNPTEGVSVHTSTTTETHSLMEDNSQNNEKITQNQLSLEPSFPSTSPQWPQANIVSPPRLSPAPKSSPTHPKPQRRTSFRDEMYSHRLQETISKLANPTSETEITESSPSTSRRSSKGGTPPSGTECLSPLVVSIGCSKLWRVPSPSYKRHSPSLNTKRVGTYCSKEVQAERGMVIDREVLDSYLSVKFYEALLGLKDRLLAMEQKVKQVTTEKELLQKVLHEKVGLIQEMTRTGFKPQLADKGTSMDGITTTEAKSTQTKPSRTARRKLVSVESQTLCTMYKAPQPEESGSIFRCRELQSGCLRQCSEEELQNVLQLSSAAASTTSTPIPSESEGEVDKPMYEDSQWLSFVDEGCARCTAIQPHIRFVKALMSRKSSASKADHSESKEERSSEDARILSQVSEDSNHKGGNKLCWKSLDQELQEYCRQLRRLAAVLKMLPLEPLLSQRVLELLGALDHLLSHFPRSDEPSAQLLEMDKYKTTGVAAWLLGSKLKQLAKLLKGLFEVPRLPQYFKAEVSVMQNMVRDALHFLTQGMRHITVFHDDHGSAVHSSVAPPSLSCTSDLLPGGEEELDELNYPSSPSSVSSLGSSISGSPEPLNEPEETVSGGAARTSALCCRASQSSQGTPCSSRKQPRLAMTTPESTCLTAANPLSISGVCIPASAASSSSSVQIVGGTCKSNPSTNISGTHVGKQHQTAIPQRLVNMALLEKVTSELCSKICKFTPNHRGEIPQQATVSNQQETNLPSVIPVAGQSLMQQASQTTLQQQGVAVTDGCVSHKHVQDVPSITDQGASSSQHTSSLPLQTVSGQVCTSQASSKQFTNVADILASANHNLVASSAVSAPSVLGAQLINNTQLLGSLLAQRMLPTPTQLTKQVATVLNPSLPQMTAIALAQSQSQAAIGQSVLSPLLPKSHPVSIVPKPVLSQYPSSARVSLQSFSPTAVTTTPCQVSSPLLQTQLHNFLPVSTSALTTTTTSTTGTPKTVPTTAIHPSSTTTPTATQFSSQVVQKTFVVPTSLSTSVVATIQNPGFTTPSSQTNTARSLQSESRPVHMQRLSILSQLSHSIASQPPVPPATSTAGGSSFTPSRLPLCPKLQAMATNQGIVVKWTFGEDMKNLQKNVGKYELCACVGNRACGLPPISEWGRVGEVKPLPLPMAVTLTNFAKGRSYSFVVRAVFNDGKMTEYSEPRSITL